MFPVNCGTYVGYQTLLLLIFHKHTIRIPMPFRVTLGTSLTGFGILSKF